MTKDNKRLLINCLIVYALQFFSFIYKPFLILELGFLIYLLISDKVENKICYLFFMLPFYNVFRFSHGGTQYSDILNSFKTLYLSTFLVLTFCLVMFVKLLYDLKLKTKKINIKELCLWIGMFLMLILPINKFNLGMLSSFLTISCLFVSLFFIVQYKECFRLKKILNIWLFAVLLSVLTYAFKDVLPYLNDYIVYFENRFGCLNRDPNYFAFEIFVLLIGYSVLYLNKIIKYEFVVAFAVLSILGVLSISKSFLIIYALYLTICFVLLFKCLLKKSKTKKQKITLILTIVFVILIAIVVVAKIVLPRLFSLRRNTFEIDDSSLFSILNGLTTGRFEIWVGYLKIFFGSFNIFLFGYGALNGYPLGAVHNSVIQILFFGGIIFFAILVYLVLKCIIKQKKHYGLHLFTLLILLFSCSLDMMFSYRTFLVIAIIMLCYNNKNNIEYKKLEKEDSLIIDEHQQKKISIIIPVYKVEKYINRCVESIVNQKYKNLEIILVDDGSPDNCPKICDEWAQKDSRIKVIHKSNGGVSSARNAGLEVASGDYITFVDSDDYLSKDFSYCASKVFDKNIYCFSYNLVDSNNSIKVEPNENWGKESINDLNQGAVSSSMYNAIWNKIFKASIIKENNLRFDTNFVIAEDLKFIIDWFKASNEMNFINVAYYNYFQNDASVMSNVTFKKIENTLSVCEYGIKQLSSIENKKTKSFIKKLIGENLITVFVRADRYEPDENKILIERLIKCKNCISYGSTIAKKLLVASIKILGVKFSVKLLKLLKKVKRK